MPQQSGMTMKIFYRMLFLLCSASLLVLALFGESLGRILVSVKPEKSEAFEKSMKGHEYSYLGKVISGDEIIFTNGKELILSSSMSELRSAWKGTLNGGRNQ